MEITGPEQGRLWTARLPSLSVGHHIHDEPDERHNDKPCRYPDKLNTSRPEWPKEPLEVDYSLSMERVHRQEDARHQVGRHHRNDGDGQPLGLCFASLHFTSFLRWDCVRRCRTQSSSYYCFVVSDSYPFGYELRRSVYTSKLVHTSLGILISGNTHSRTVFAGGRVGEL